MVQELQLDTYLTNIKVLIMINKGNAFVFVNAITLLVGLSIAYYGNYLINNDQRKMGNIFSFFGLSILFVNAIFAILKVYGYLKK